MKSKHIKKNNRSREYSNRKIQETDTTEDNLLERILSEEGAFSASNDDFEIDIIGMASDEKKDTDDIIDDYDDELDDDMASRLSLYESISDEDEEDEIKEFATRDVVAESRRRVNQPGRRKFEDNAKPKLEKQPKKKKERVKDRDVKAEDKTSVIDNLKEIYGKYTMHILYSALGMLVVVLLIAIIVVPKNDSEEGTGTKADLTSVVDNKTGDTKDESNDETDGDSTEETSTEKTVTMADLKAEGEDTEIHKLITGFIDAERIKCDEEKAKSYLEVADGYKLAQSDKLKRYVEAYQDIKCYKFDYLTDGMYYIFVSYKIKIANINTPAVAANAFVVRYNEEQGKFLIVTSYTKEELAYKVVVENSPEIKALEADVIKRQEEALAKDSVLKEFIGIMQGTSNSEESNTENKAN